MKTVPCRLEPTFVPRIWGARSLDPLFPVKVALREPIGEVWLTGNDCTFASGPFLGQRLTDAWRTMPRDWAGKRLDTSKPFPLLVKFLFPEDILSIQVHPGDEYAREHEADTGWTGKTEMWHTVAARKGAEVLVGLKEDVTPESFRAAIEGGTVEHCLVRIPVEPGDSIFVPAGTVHTIGPGVVLCEIQENSDLTYRVYDYNRKGLDGKPRPLHLEKALAVARFGEQRGGRVIPARTTRGSLTQDLYVACRYFVTERWEFSAPVEHATGGGAFELLIILDGRGRVKHAGGAEEFSHAQAWFLPAALGKIEMEPEGPVALLRTWVPDMERVAGELNERGFDYGALSRVVFSD